MTRLLIEEIGMENLNQAERELRLAQIAREFRCNYCQRKDGFRMPGKNTAISGLNNSAVSTQRSEGDGKYHS